MELEISSLSELSAQIMPYMKRGVVTNAFLPPSVYAAEIAERRLFVDSGDGFLGLYFRREDFCHFYYYALGGAPVFSSEPLICETVGEAPDFISAHFSPILSRVRLIRAPLDLTAERDERIRFLDKADAKDGFALLCSCFDRRTAALPTFTEFLSDCAERRAIGLLSENRLTGLLRFSSSAKRAEIRHVCVSPLYRRNGGAAALCRFFLSQNGKKNVTVFTGAENAAARTLYTAFGFVPDNITSVVYQKGALS